MHKLVCLVLCMYLFVVQAKEYKDIKMDFEHIQQKLLNGTELAQADGVTHALAEALTLLLRDMIKGSSEGHCKFTIIIRSLPFLTLSHCFSPSCSCGDAKRPTSDQDCQVRVQSVERTWTENNPGWNSNSFQSI